MIVPRPETIRLKSEPVHAELAPDGVAISGDGATLVVGAPDEDSGATSINGDQTDNSAGNRGAAYAYTSF